MAGLAALAALADALLGRYGPCSVTINRSKTFTVEGGDPLLAVLLDAGVFVPSSCGGRGSCGLCKVKVLEGGGPLLPTEEPLLSPEDIEASLRLSCQIKVRRDLAIEIPEELLSVRRFHARVDALRDLTHEQIAERLRYFADAAKARLARRS